MSACEGRMVVTINDTIDEDVSKEMTQKPVQNKRNVNKRKQTQDLKPITHSKVPNEIEEIERR